MSSTNQGPEYFSAEKKYLVSETIDEKIFWLQEMMKHFKKHKGSENMLAELKRRMIKLKEKEEKSKKARKGAKGIRKEGFQVILLGLPNSGKSSIVKAITNASPNISEHPFTTKEPILGTMQFQGVQAQIVDLPSVGSKTFDYSILHGADCVLLVVENLDDLTKLNEIKERTSGREIVVVNKADILNENGLRKLEAKMKSKRLNYVITSAKTQKGIEELKGKIMNEMGVIRVFMKEPGKPKSDKPVVLKTGSTVLDVAESIYKGFSKTVKETKLTGPSGKFANQKVGMQHVCKDMDIVEFKT